MHKPPEIIAQKGVKQISEVTSAERGFNTSMIGCINAVGNYFPPFFIFPRVNFKRNMLHGAPPGSVGAANPTGWSTSDIFISTYYFWNISSSIIKPSIEDKV